MEAEYDGDYVARFYFNRRCAGGVAAAVEQLIKPQKDTGRCYNPKVGAKYAVDYLSRTLEVFIMHRAASFIYWIMATVDVAEPF